MSQCDGVPGNFLPANRMLVSWDIFYDPCVSRWYSRPEFETNNEITRAFCTFVAIRMSTIMSWVHVIHAPRFQRTQTVRSSNSSALCPRAAAGVVLLAPSRLQQSVWRRRNHPPFRFSGHTRTGTTIDSWWGTTIRIDYCNTIVMQPISVFLFRGTVLNYVGDCSNAYAIVRTRQRRPGRFLFRHNSKLMEHNSIQNWWNTTP